MNNTDTIALGLKLDQIQLTLDNGDKAGRQLLETVLSRLTNVEAQLIHVEAQLKAVGKAADYLKEVVGKLRVEANPPPAPPPPEQWILRCVGVDEDEEDDEFRFYAGTVAPNRAVWTTDWRDAFRYSSLDVAAAAAKILAADGRGMPTCPVGCIWKIWTQPVLFGKAGKPEYIENQYRFWTQVYPKSYPASRS